MNITSVVPVAPEQPKKQAALRIADLNRLVGQVIKDTCPAGMVIRRDSLPVIAGSSLQLYHAFRLLLQAVVAYPPQGSRHLLYFKFKDPQALAGSTGAHKGVISIVTNINTQTCCSAAIQESFENARALFLVNGIHISAPQSGADDCIYLLTIAGKPDT